MRQGTIKAWYLVHKWSSLVCTLFLLMLCVTGLPLIFHDELEDALGYHQPLPAVAPGTRAPTIDAMVSRALAARPGEVPVSAFFEPERPVFVVGTAASVDAPFAKIHNQPIDRRSGAFLKPPPRQEGFLHVMEEAHTEMFAGLPGTLFLGAMGLLFLFAIVSGVVVYAPFMRKLGFGTIRSHRSSRLRWLDLHNFLGIATVAWLSVVAVTGVFNTLDMPLAMQWKNGQLADMVAPYRGLPKVERTSSVDTALAAAMAVSPGMRPSSISWPGSFFSTPHHFNIFMKGGTPVTSRLLKPALVDARTGKLTDSRDMPLHIRALFLSRPLHFGDYGGVALKIVWAMLDLVATAVLGSGLYLWIGRRSGPAARRVTEIATGGVEEGA